MNLEKMQGKCAAMLGSGESLVAAAGVNPGLAGAGMVAGQKAGSGPAEEGKVERETAAVDVGKATQVLLAVTDRRVVMIKLFGQTIDGNSVVAALQK